MYSIIQCDVNGIRALRKYLPRCLVHICWTSKLHFVYYFLKEYMDIFQVRNCLITPILTKHETTRRYQINFDPYIQEVIREAEYMYKLDLG